MLVRRRGFEHSGEKRKNKRRAARKIVGTMIDDDLVVTRSNGCYELTIRKEK